MKNWRKKMLITILAILCQSFLLNSGAVNLRLREKEGVTSPAAAENNLEVITITSLLAAHGPTKLIGLNFEKSVPLKGKCKILCQRIFRRQWYLILMVLNFSIRLLNMSKVRLDWPIIFFFLSSYLAYCAKATIFCCKLAWEQLHASVKHPLYRVRELQDY